MYKIDSSVRLVYIGLQHFLCPALRLVSNFKFQARSYRGGAHCTGACVPFYPQRVGTEGAHFLRKKKKEKKKEKRRKKWKKLAITLIFVSSIMCGGFFFKLQKN